MLAEFDDAELPPDLQRLAEQLHREADALTECYPAERSEAGVPPRARAHSSTRRLGRWLLGGSTAAALLWLLVWSSFAWQAGESQTNQRPDASLAAGTDSDKPEASFSPAATSRQPMPVYPVGVGLYDGTHEADPRSAPALSAPEWEAVLDLTPAEKWEGVELSL
jgi:hypothetical protein